MGRESGGGEDCDNWKQGSAAASQSPSDGWMEAKTRCLGCTACVISSA